MEPTPSRTEHWRRVLKNNPELLNTLTPRLNKYIPVTLTAPQAVFLLRPERESLFGGSAGGGKATPLSTPIPTPQGWTTMGQLKPGDQVFDEQGQLCNVTGAYPVNPVPESYRLTFDDNSTIEACADHQWLTYDAKELAQLTRFDPKWKVARRAKRSSRVSGNKSEAFTASLTKRNQERSLASPGRPLPTGSIRTTHTIFETLRTERGRTNHAIPVAKALDLPEAKLPLDPYLLGLWLGDGSTAGYTYASQDPELVAAFDSAGFAARQIAPYGFHVSGITPCLTRLGVKHNKHIPPQYLRASREQRLALLQGLLDSDGTVEHSGAPSFTNTSKPIIDGTYELIVSLGWKAGVSEGRAKLYGKDCGPVWDIRFTPDEYVFRLPRKLDKQRLGTRRTNRFRYIVKCEPIDPIPMRCISVDSSSHLYLAGRQMVPTHNSIALLAGALQYVDLPGYAALLIRRTLKELSLPGGLLAVGHQWLINSDARWDFDNKTWHFPSGSTLTFGYLDTEADLERYQGSEYQYIGVDEAAQFEEDRYTYLMSRMRRSASSQIPLRMRLASNPGSIGGPWIKRRFMTEGMQATPPRSFIPARVTDNPYLDQQSYIENLMQLNDPIKRAQLLYGDWDIVNEGEFFQPGWFRYTPAFPAIKYIRFWDLSAQTATHKDSDWTVGALVGIQAGRIYIKNIARMRGNPGEVETFVYKTASRDGRSVHQYIEQEGGSSGVNTVFNYKTRVLKDFNCDGWRPKGTKIDRARLWSGYVQKEQCFLPTEADWHKEFMEEVQLFPTPKAHDDQVDAVSGAVAMLLQSPEPRIRFIDAYQDMKRNLRNTSPTGTVTVPPATPEEEAAEVRLARLRKASRPAHLRNWD